LFVDHWIGDIVGTLNADAIGQSVRLWLMIEGLNWDPTQRYKFYWPLSPKRTYTAKSTYTRICFMVPSGWILLKAFGN
jgi:hypothetical protein